MKKNFATIYAILCALTMFAGFFLVFLFAYKAGLQETILGCIGLFLGLIFAPIVHELGHVAFAKGMQMECIFIKCFCFKMFFKDGKRKCGFASPFASDQTQTLPKRGGNMQNRAEWYTLGGLIFGGAFLLILFVLALVFTGIGNTKYLLWGMIPYTAYLFFLNLLPLHYPTGKTDTLVYKGIVKGYDAEKTMLSAMEIFGQLYEGKSFCEIDRELYFDLPQLCEDEPMFSVILDLRYRYYLEKGDLQNAADCLNRLAYAQAYLPIEECEKIGAELVYFHSIHGNITDANECAKTCEKYLQENNVLAKRALLAFSVSAGKTEAIEALLKQAEEALQKERLSGIRKSERILLDRLVKA